MAVVRRKIIAYCRAAQKAADWLESRQQASGVVDPENGVGAVYKTTAAFVAAGRLHAAWKLMDYIGAHYVVEPGEFQSSGGSGARVAGGSFYRNCWILMSAIRLGRFDIASPAAIEHTLRYQHRSGGFCGSLKRAERQRINPLFTAMGGWFCLYTGRHDRAVRAGDFLLRLIASQAEMPERFYFHIDARSGACITEYPPGTAIMHYADRQRAVQHFFFSGAMMGYLADLHQATGEKKYLQGARAMFDFESGMNPRSFAWISKCKVGWGAALLYAVTGEAVHRKMAEKVADVTFVKAQNPKGHWSAALVPTNDDGSGFTLPSVELTGEFAFELCEVAKALTTTTKVKK